MLRACLLTIAVETAFFACTRYRKTPLFLCLAACVNGATNLGLNLLLGFLARYGAHYGAETLPVFGGTRFGFRVWFLALLESIVVLAEYGVYRSFFNGSGGMVKKRDRPFIDRNLLLYTIIANVLSIVTGLLL